MTEVLQTPIKSPNDKNLYRMIKLENGLKVLIIQHESEEMQAAVVMNIDVGGYDDPPEAKGLAHFLEHMVFMGSEKYPKENEYHEFVSSHGGDLNAQTGFKETIFYLNIGEDALEGAIDRFSGLFVSPLMLENSIERELEAVDSEFMNRKNNDYVRLAQMLYNSVNDDHPAKCFIPGNLKTLKEVRTNSELYQLVHDHRLKFYVSNRMTLSIESSKSLNELQSMVEKYFSAIEKGTARAAVPQDEYKNIFKPQSHEKIIYMKPKSDLRVMTLFWVLPRIDQQYKVKPLGYLEKLIKNQFEGGLASYLKEKLLVTNLMVEQNAGDFGDVPLVSSFTIAVFMSEYGSKRIVEILEAIYSYLLLIKETPMEKHREIFENYQNISAMNFKFKEAQSASENTRHGARGMHTFDDIDVLRGSKLTLEYNEEVLKNFIDLINEPNFNIAIVDHQAEIEYDRVEKYFGTEYKEVDLPEEFKRVWNEKKILPEFSLPPKNEYVCTNFDIYADMEGADNMDYPVKIFENEVAETWYKLDSEFKSPKVFIYAKVDSPLNHNSPFNYALANILIDMTIKHLKIKYASAIEAGLEFNIFLSENSFRFRFSGYNEKMELLINNIMKDFKLALESFDESTFNMYKEDFTDSYKNTLLAGNFANSLTEHLVHTNYTFIHDNYLAFGQVNYEHIEKFVEKCFKKLKIQILVQGNFLKDQALSVMKTILDSFNAEPVDDLSTIELLNLQLPEGNSSIRIKSFQKHDINSYAVEIFDLGPRSSKLDALGSVFDGILSEPFFDILRTKELLAYSLGSQVSKKYHSIILRLALKHQEDKFSSKFIADRLKKFIVEDTKEIIESLTDEKLNKIKEGKIRELLEPFPTSDSEATYNMNRIMDKSYIFDEYVKQANVIGGITKEDLMDFYTTNFITNKHRNLTVQIVGENEDEENVSMALKLITEELDENLVVSDLKAFKESLMTYPKYEKNYA